jgi:hypothetical protein
MKCVIRFRGSQALSGIIKYEIKARIVTPAMIIGASHKKLAFTLRGRRRGTYNSKSAQSPGTHTARKG